MDKKDGFDHKLKVHRIPTNTSQKELHHMDLQETIVLRTKRERGSHLATNYGPVGLEWTTHASSERHQWAWWTPLWWCLDWIGCLWNLRRLELIFGDSPMVSRILGYYREKSLSRGTWGGHNPPGRTRASSAPMCLVLTSGPLFGTSLAHWMSSSTKNLQKFLLRLYSVWYWYSAK